MNKNHCLFLINIFSSFSSLTFNRWYGLTALAPIFSENSDYTLSGYFHIETLNTPCYSASEHSKFTPRYLCTSLYLLWGFHIYYLLIGLEVCSLSELITIVLEIIGTKYYVTILWCHQLILHTQIYPLAVLMIIN